AAPTPTDPQTRPPPPPAPPPPVPTNVVFPGSATLHPSGTPEIVALSESSASPVTDNPLSVIGLSSLPTHTLVGPNTGASATPLAVTLRTSTALVPRPSGVLTVSVRNALSPPWSGALTTSRPRSPALTTPEPPPPVPNIVVFPGSATLHPSGTPEIVALSESSPSPDTDSPLSVIPASSLPTQTLVAPNTGSSATPLAVTLRTSTALVPRPSGVLTVSVRNALSPPWSGALTTRRPRSPALTTPEPPPPVPNIVVFPGSATLHPSGTPESVALSESSPSPVTDSPLSVIGPSSLPTHTLVAPNTGSSATPLAVTLRTSTALVPAPSGVLTVSVRK